MRCSSVLPWLALLSCAPPLALEGAPCPCAADWLCCPTALVCVRDVSSCPITPGPVVAPVNVTLGAGRKQRFTSNAPDTTWTIEEGPAGGTIDEGGHYRAPDAPGEYHLVASAGGGVTRVTVTVRALRLSVLAGNYGGTSTRPIDGVGARARFADPKGLLRIGEWLYFTDNNTLRRVHPTTRAVETLVRPGLEVAEPPPDHRIGNIKAIGPSTADSLVFLESDCVRELRVTDRRIQTINCSRDASDRRLALAGDEQAVYWGVFRGLVRWDRRTRMTSTLLALPQADELSLLRQRGTELVYLHQNAGAVSRLDLTSGTSSVLIPQQGLRFIGLVLTEDDRGPITLAAATNGSVIVADERGQRWERTIQESAVGFESDETGPFPVSFVMTRPSLLRTDGFDVEVLAGRPRGPVVPVDGPGAAAALFPRVGIAAAGSVVWVNEGPRLRRVERDGTTTTIPTYEPGGLRSFASTGSALVGLVSQTNELVVFRDGAWRRTPFVASLSSRIAGVLEGDRVVVIDGSKAKVVSLSGEVLREVRLPSEPVREGTLDPTGEGGLCFTIRLAGESLNGAFRFDLESGQLTRLAPPFAPDATVPSIAAVDLPRVYGPTRIGGGVGATGPVFGSTVSTASVTSPWSTLVGNVDVPMVEPGPLPGLIQTAAALAVLDNGDLVIADSAENVLLVVE